MDLLKNNYKEALKLYNEITKSESYGLKAYYKIAIIYVTKNEFDKEYYLEILKATVLKVAHHGSKSSSTNEFLKAVNSKVAMIGVGENNMFGHPSNVVLERLQSFRYAYF